MPNRPGAGAADGGDARTFRLAAAANALVATVGIVVGQMVWHRPDEFFRGHLLDTGVSTIQIIAVGVVCWQVFRVREATPGAHAPGLWRLLAVGFVFLALDEAVELHEHMDTGIHALLGIRETPITDRLDDLIVLLYGVGGLAILWRNRDELRCFRPLVGYLAVSAVMFALMVAVDFATSRPELALRVGGSAQVWEALQLGRAFEEALKLVAEGMLLGTAYAALLRARALPGAAIAPIATPAEPAAAPPAA